MFQQYDIPCHRTDFHISHEYFGGWRHFFDTVICPGILRKHQPTKVAEPDAGYRWVIQDHKHNLRLMGFYNQSNGRLSLSTELSFKCRDPKCAYEAIVTRWKYNELILDYSKVNQTWPG
jgi:hypothetical protein